MAPPPTTDFLYAAFSNSLTFFFLAYNPLSQKMFNPNLKLQCPACGNEKAHNFTNFYFQENVPATQNILYYSKQEAQRSPKGTLNLKQCTLCGMIHNFSFNPNLVIYNTNNPNRYENNCFFSHVYDHYIQRIIHLLKTRFNIQNARIFEIACGNGEFLKRLCFQTNSYGIGFDPSCPPPPEKNVEFHAQIYQGSPVFNHLDLIVCRHCLEHIQNPYNFLLDLLPLLKENPQAFIYFETPRLEWIIENKTFFDFFYEHCNYFTKSSIEILFSRAKMEILDIIPSFNEQYQLIFAKYNHFQTGANLLENLIVDLINRLKQYKNIAIWGCGAKGVTLANQLPNIACVIDLNPKKQNAYVPGVALPILSPESAFSHFLIDAVLVVNNNYFNEIKNKLKELHHEKIPLETI